MHFKEILFNGVKLNVSPHGMIFRGAHKYTPTKCRSGYLSIAVLNGNDRKRLSIHRAVALAYLSNAKNLPCVNHKDGVKENNHFSNLEWITHKDNTKHAFATGLMKSRVGVSSDKQELNSAVKTLHDKGFTQDKLARIFNLSQARISQILSK